MIPWHLNSQYQKIIWKCAHPRPDDCVLVRAMLRTTCTGSSRSSIPPPHTEHEGCTWTDHEGYLHWHFLWESIEEGPQSQKFSTETSVSAQTPSTLVLGTHICLQNQNLSKPCVIDWSAWFALVKARLEEEFWFPFWAGEEFLSQQQSAWPPVQSLAAHSYAMRADYTLADLPWHSVV